MQEEGWVVCRAFKKRTTGQNKSIEAWDSIYFYDEPSGVSSVVDPIEYISRQPQNFLAHNFLCKQEIEAENLNFFHSDQFVELPQLESPSMPQIKRPSSSISLISEKNEEDEQIRGLNNNQKVTDWRALDKFVASQLSQEDKFVERDRVESSFGARNNSDMALLLLQSDREEANKLNGFLSSSSECDIGICIFDK